MQIANHPPHVEYGLTRTGSEVGPAVEDLAAWRGRQWLAPSRARAWAKAP